MPFDAQHALNNLGERVSEVPMVKRIVKNPFYTAILISLIIVVVILFVFRNVELKGTDDSLSRLAIRSGIYSLMAVTVVQFLQNQHVLNDAKRETQSSQIDEVFEYSTPKAVGVGPDQSLHVKVEPNVQMNH